MPSNWMIFAYRCRECGQVDTLYRVLGRAYAPLWCRLHGDRMVKMDLVSEQGVAVD